MDRLRAFEVFATVVARGSFTRAADALDTSPANVTRYVSELEAYLGTRLLNRTSRRLSLTESGEALYERAKSILEDVAEAETIASASALHPRGRLRINVPVSFGTNHLAPLWPKFMARHPDIELDIDLSDRVVDLVEEGYDLAVRISRSGSLANVGRKLADSRNMLCASPAFLARAGTPQTLEELPRYSFLAYSLWTGGDTLPFIDAQGKTHPVRMNPIMHANNGGTLRAAALAGLGIVNQPTFLVGEDIRAGRLVELLPDYRLPDIDILAVYPSRRHLSLKVRAMVDFLVECFRGTPSWDCASA
ncbi:LysR family transcriptional regulator [Sphingomonas oligoaromativorans]|uniref:LysR family transcriptional regulator n=1 Tax=Sphingomonas oligoaromativorans TaxID=575322 RepID=UPI001423ABBA|nr:LysR family transcriptional regulator [Sphingomonas oligoaromativorans]NIJ33244.1 DNA-binding transcriptional LysR family regulator [Sphingomonas oligoaromativorans]